MGETISYPEGNFYPSRSSGTVISMQYSYRKKQADEAQQIRDERLELMRQELEQTKIVINEQAWKDKKTTIMGIIMVILSTIGIVYTGFSFEKQMSVYNILNQIYDLIIPLSLLITGLINIFKTIWKK